MTSIHTGTIKSRPVQPLLATAPTDDYSLRCAYQLSLQQKSHTKCVPGEVDCVICAHVHRLPATNHSGGASPCGTSYTHIHPKEWVSSVTCMLVTHTVQFHESRSPRWPRFLYVRYIRYSTKHTLIAHVYTHETVRIRNSGIGSILCTLVLPVNDMIILNPNPIIMLQRGCYSSQKKKLKCSDHNLQCMWMWVCGNWWGKMQVKTEDYAVSIIGTRLASNTSALGTCTLVYVLLHMQSSAMMESFLHHGWIQKFDWQKLTKWVGDVSGEWLTFSMTQRRDH